MRRRRDGEGAAFIQDITANLALAAPLVPYVAFAPAGREAVLARGFGDGCVLNSDSPDLPIEVLPDAARHAAATRDA
ncbi:MAG: hypothetical protein JO157_10500 [Acetobacteraceae bacterium]|nr:hypothetical protein [Acetobacteraceae bacterium]